VAPESRYEVMDGKVIYVAPADEPHGSRHSKVSALVEAHAAREYDVASDMLTRTSEQDDVAPDVSVFPAEHDPATGRRRLEELAFEVVSTERLGHAGRKAAKLVGRGVRRVFAIDVERQRAFEWSPAVESWSILPDSGRIEDRALAVPLPIEALVRAAKTDDAIARALLAKQNPVIEEELRSQRAQGKAEGKAEGKIEGLLLMLRARRLDPTERELAVLRDPSRVDDIDLWITHAATCTSVAALLLLRSD